ncbi:hypothetical protein HID58_088635, partial [Brassica napus]
RRRIKIFDPIELTPKKDDGKPGEEEDHRKKKVRKEAAATARTSAKDAAARAGDPDEEKYRLGYGVAGKGVKLSWYVENKREYEDRAGGEGEEEEDGGRRSESKKKSGKKSLKELREERLKRERVEKERERALFMKQSQRSGPYDTASFCGACFCKSVQKLLFAQLLVFNTSLLMIKEIRTSSF